MKGFAQARGDIFCWLNADDYWLGDDVVERAVARIIGGADVVTAGGARVDEEGRRVLPIHPLWGRSMADLRYAALVLQPATFWRRSAHRPLRADMHYAFDWKLFLDIAALGSRWDVVDEEWAAYRFHGSNKSMLDPARRRGEVADIVGTTCGKRSAQYLWARLVYRCFDRAERGGSDLPKKWILGANRVLRRASGGRVYSC